VDNLEHKVREIIYSFDDATKKIMRLMELFPPQVNYKALEELYPSLCVEKSEVPK
jgi:hypothetical protein